MTLKHKASADLAEEEVPTKALKRSHSDSVLNRTNSDADPQQLIVKSQAETRLLADIVPEAKLRGVVQQLLVGLDLSTTTVGALRAQLEKTLNLAAGALSARKSIRRRVDLLVQHEAMKKAHRSPECEKIAKELLELPEYPCDAKQMLIDSLPHATTSSLTCGSLHSHQVQLLTIIQDALRQARRPAESASEAAQAHLHEIQSDLDTLIAQLEGYRQVAVEAKDAFAAATESFKEAQQEVRHLEEELEKAKEAVRLALEETARIRLQRDEILQMRSGPFQKLVEGDWSNDNQYWESFAGLQQYLMDNNAESSLLTAATVALRKKPSERSLFDNMATKGVEQLLDQLLQAADARVAARSQAEFKAEALCLSASSILKATTSHADEQGKSLEVARAADDRAAAALQSAEAQLPQKQSLVAKRQTDLKRFADKLQNMDEVLALLEGWISSGKCSSSDNSSPEVAAEVVVDPELKESTVDNSFAQEMTPEVCAEVVDSISEHLDTPMDKAPLENSELTRVPTPLRQTGI